MTTITDMSYSINFSEPILERIAFIDSQCQGMESEFFMFDLDTETNEFILSQEQEDFIGMHFFEQEENSHEILLWIHGLAIERENLLLSMVQTFQKTETISKKART